MAVHFKEIIAEMERLAPLGLKEAWDNPGLLVGDPDKDIASILLTLDVTAENVAYAVDNGFDAIISHHPVIFSGLKALRTDTYDGRMFASLLSHGLSVYCAHTNLDSAVGGVNDVLARILELEDVRPLGAEGTSAAMGRVGVFREAMKAAEALVFVKNKLNRPVLAYGGTVNEAVIRKVALCGGAGTSFMAEAAAAGADMFVTGDMKYHDAQEAEKEGILLVDGGHYGTEFPVVFELQRILSAAGGEKDWHVDFIVDSTSKDFISYI